MIQTLWTKTLEMANHAYVKFETPIDPQSIIQTLEEISKKYFEGYVEIHTETNEDGETYFLFHTPTNSIQIQSWLSPDRLTFEIRHGAGGDLAWYCDDVICAEIANQYEGYWWDDGFGPDEKIDPDLHLGVMFPQSLMRKYGRHPFIISFFSYRLAVRHYFHDKRLKEIFKKQKKGA